MPKKWVAVHGKPFDEAKWKRAKEIAEEEGQGENYAYITGIYKRMERITANAKPRKKTLRKGKGVRLILADGLDEFRCSECGTLLLKGTNLQKAFIETKCHKCGTIVSNQ